MMIVDDDRAAGYIHTMRFEGHSYISLIDGFREKFPEYRSLSHDWVRKQYNLWVKEKGISPVNNQYVTSTVKVNKPRNHFLHDKDNPTNYLPRAIVLHLIDIKRAGHSPTRTELRVCPRTDKILPKIVKPKSNIVEIKEPQKPLQPPPVKQDIQTEKLSIKIRRKRNKTPDELICAHMNGRQRTSIKTIIDMVSKEVNIDVKTILSGSRRSDICEARYLIFWLARHAEYSLPQIARGVGLKDHTSVLNGLKRYNAILERGGFRADMSQRLLSVLVTNKPAPYWGA